MATLKYVQTKHTTISYAIYLIYVYIFQYAALQLMGNEHIRKILLQRKYFSNPELLCSL